jgi:hypothetical protein
MRAALGMAANVADAHGEFNNFTASPGTPSPGAGTRSVKVVRV